MRGHIDRSVLKWGWLLVVVWLVALWAILEVAVCFAQTTFVYTPEGTYTVHAIPSGVDNQGRPLGVESGQGRDSYTNYTVTPPIETWSIGKSGKKTKRMVIEVEEDD